MSVPGTSGLLDDIKVAFVVPAVTYGLILLVDRATPHAPFKSLFRRIALASVLILFFAALTATIYQDRPVWIALWRQSPILYSLVDFLFCAGVAGGVAGLVYWRLRPSLWRRARPGSREEAAER